MAELTTDEVTKLKAMAAAEIKADVVAELVVTRNAEMGVAKASYSAATKVAVDKYSAAVAALEG